MRRVWAVLCLWLVTPVAAEPAYDDLARAMRLTEVVEILREEGLRYGATLDTELLEGAGGAFFAAQVARIYAPDRMHAALRNALSDHLDPEQAAAATAFFSTATGQTILTLENSARRAFADDGIEEMALDRAEEAGEGDPRLGQVAAYVAANDLIGQNVKGAISADFQFYRGLSDGQGTARDDGAVLASLLEARDETEAETRRWVMGFLYFAYTPLEDDQMQANIAFSQSAAGKALNAALFEGFDRLYGEISYDLGRATGFALKASDI